MRAIGYTRVSTGAQGENGLGMDAQRTQLAAECERRDWELLDIEHDVASGKSTNGRHGLARAIGRIEAGEAEALVVTKLDRLARSSLDFARHVERARDEGWTLVILELALDTSTPMGKFTASVVAAMAELERDLISQRTKMALAEAKRQGRLIGRPGGKVESDAQTVALIKTLRGQRLSYRAIATELDAQSIPAPRGRGWNQESVRRAALSD